MEKEKMSEGVVRCFLGSARDYTPITVSADFAALTRSTGQRGVAEGSGKKTGAGMASNPLNHIYEGVTTRSGL